MVVAALRVPTGSFAPMFLPIAMRSIVAPLLVCLLSLAFFRASAQDSTLSVQDRSAILLARIASADSSQDALTSVGSRLDLAPLVRPSQAVQLHLQAIALIDTAHLSPAIALRAHRGLAELFTGMSEMTKANREWVQVVGLTEEVLKREAIYAVETAETGRALSVTRADSLIHVMAADRARALVVQDKMTADFQQRTYLAIVAIVAGLIALLVSVLLFTQHNKRLRAELKELQQEVTWLRLVSKKPIEPQPVAVPEVGTAPVIAPPVVPAPSFAAGEDAVLLALVRKRSQERINTLRDARARGDMDKVVRVVHSLKPQLVSIDADRFTGVCARLVATAASENSAQWNQDLDVFEAGLEQTLGR